MIKPCPFCGQKPKVEPWYSNGQKNCAVTCRSDNCPAVPYVVGRNRAEALRYWNTRAESSPPEEQK